MESVYPKQMQSEALLEGVASHDAGEKMINGHPTPKVGGYLTEEGLEAAEQYATNVRETGRAVLTEKQYRSNALGVKQTVYIDCMTYDNQPLIVWDYKSGRSVAEAEGNWQLINYLAIVLHAAHGHNPEGQHYTLRIVQPRGFHREGTVRDWVVTYDQIKPYFDQLKAAAIETESDNPRCISGTWCHGCRALLDCSAASNMAARAIDYMSNATPDRITTSNIGKELEIIEAAAKVITKREDALKAQIETYITMGERVSNYSMISTESALKWNDTSQAISLGELSDIDIRKPQDCKTPTQAISLGMDRATVESFCKRTKGLKLTKINATKIFGD